MRERWNGQPAAHGLKTPLPAKRPETDASAPAPWARHQSERTVANANHQRAEQARYSVFGGDRRPDGAGEHLERYNLLPNV